MKNLSIKVAVVIHAVLIVQAHTCLSSAHAHAPIDPEVEKQHQLWLQKRLQRTQPHRALRITTDDMPDVRTDVTTPHTVKPNVSFKLRTAREQARIERAKVPSQSKKEIQRKKKPQQFTFDSASTSEDSSSRSSSDFIIEIQDAEEDTDTTPVRRTTNCAIQ